RRPRCPLLRRNVVETVAQALADLVGRPPGDVTDIDLERLEHLAGGRDHVVERYLPAAEAPAFAEAVHLDVDPDEKAPLSRSENDASLVDRIDDRLETNVGKVGPREDVHHPPDLVRVVSLKLEPEGLPNQAAGPVAADREAGPHRFHQGFAP